MVPKSKWQIMPVNHIVRLGQTTLAYCFGRLEEITSVYENKNLTFKMAEILLEYGADIDREINQDEGLTLLMQFCEMPPSSDINTNLDVIKFLLEHGANPEQRSKTGQTAYDFAKENPLYEEISNLIRDTKPKPLTVIKKSKNGIPLIKENGLKLDSKSIICGCFVCLKKK